MKARDYLSQLIRQKRKVVEYFTTLNLQDRELLSGLNKLSVEFDQARQRLALNDSDLEKMTVEELKKQAPVKEMERKLELLRKTKHDLEGTEKQELKSLENHEKLKEPKSAKKTEEKAELLNEKKRDLESFSLENQNELLPKKRGTLFDIKKSRDKKTSGVKKVLIHLKNDKVRGIFLRYENKDLEKRKHAHFAQYLDWYADERDKELDETGKRKEKNPRLHIVFFGKQIGKNLGHAATDKVNAAKNFAAFLRGEEVSFTPNEIKALKNGDLNKILRRIFINNDTCNKFIKRLPVQLPKGKKKSHPGQ